MNRELLVLDLLGQHPEGAYGSDLVKESGGTLRRSEIYFLLGKLEEQGKVLATEEQPSGGTLPRTRYQLIDTMPPVDAPLLQVLDIAAQVLRCDKRPDLADAIDLARRLIARPWHTVSERLPEPGMFCDWLMPRDPIKCETWMLCGESIVTASVPGRATHWRPAQPLPQADER